MKELALVYITRFKIYNNSPTCLDPSAHLVMFHYECPHIMFLIT